MDTWQALRDLHRSERVRVTASASSDQEFVVGTSGVTYLKLQPHLLEMALAITRDALLLFESLGVKGTVNRLRIVPSVRYGQQSHSHRSLIKVQGI